MSCIYFHSRDDGEVRLSGPERHLMGGLVDDLMMGMIGHGDWILRYLPKEAGRFFASPRDRASFGPWLRHDDRARFIVDGEEAEPFHVALNTALVLGNDALKLAARLHGQCELHCWVDGCNRAWLASIMRDGLDLNIFRTGEGWEGVIGFLGRSSATPIVCSYSVCESFPNFGSLPADHPIRLDSEHRTDDERFDPFYEMPPEEAWDACMQGLRAQGGGLELSPQNWNEIRRTMMPNNTQTKTYTPEEIRELIGDLKQEHLVACHEWGEPDPQDLVTAASRAADALEYLLQFVEWKPMEEAHQDGSAFLATQSSTGGNYEPRTATGKTRCPARHHHKGFSEIDLTIPSSEAEELS